MKLYEKLAILIADANNYGEASLGKTTDVLSSFLTNHHLVEQYHEIDFFRFNHGQSHPDLLVFNRKTVRGSMPESNQDRVARDYELRVTPRLVGGFMITIKGANAGLLATDNEAEYLLKDLWFFLNRDVGDFEGYTRNFDVKHFKS